MADDDDVLGSQSSVQERESGNAELCDMKEGHRGLPCKM